MSGIQIACLETKGVRLIKLTPQADSLTDSAEDGNMVKVGQKYEQMKVKILAKFD